MNLKQAYPQAWRHLTKVNHKLKKLCCYSIENQTVKTDLEAADTAEKNMRHHFTMKLKIIERNFPLHNFGNINNYAISTSQGRRNLKRPRELH